MSRKRRRGPALVNIPFGPNTRPGAVYLEGEFPEFRLRCTVRGCGWKATEEFYLDAQRLGHAHAAGHQSGRVSRGCRSCCHSRRG